MTILAMYCLMNRKSVKQRAEILRCLVEGNSIASTSRITGAAPNTITKLLIELGQACEAYQDVYLRNLPCKRVQVDEIWTFVYSKQKNTPEHRKGIAGDAYTWTAICADTKLMPCWLVATREAVYAKAFMRDLSRRLKNRIQLTTDGHKPYPEAVELAFGDDVDYARTIKDYAKCKGDDEPFIITQVVTGNPNPELITNNHVERHNRTLRMGMRRFTRKTDAFSKKLENHAYMVAVFMMYYNFVRIHQSLRVTPAMEAGVTDRLWSLEDMIELTDWKFEIK